MMSDEKAFCSASYYRTCGTAISHGPRISFLYFWAQTRIPGAMKVTSTSVNAKRHPTVVDSSAVRYNDNADRAMVRTTWTPGGANCRRMRKMGNNAKDCTENSVRANTAILVDSRDARTTDADMAAFIERTNVKRSRCCPSPLEEP